jgi:hypothetical protein
MSYNKASKSGPETNSGNQKQGGPEANSGNRQQGGPAENSGNQQQRDSLLSLLSRVLSGFTYDLSKINSDTIKRLWTVLLLVRGEYDDSKKRKTSLKKQLDVATTDTDIQLILSELKKLKEMRKHLKKQLDIAGNNWFSSETAFQVHESLKSKELIHFAYFQRIGCLFDEQYMNPLLGLWLLRHIIQTTTHQIDRDWATCFLSLAILRGNCISYDTSESDTRDKRIQNFSDPRNADKFMSDVECQQVRNSYEYYRKEFLSKHELDKYSKKARTYIDNHPTEREEQMF